MEGTLLDPLLRLQCTWKEWKRLHPETWVMDLPHDPKQRDPRGGHGAEEYFGRPGMDQIFISSLSMDLDRRLPENEVIIGVNLSGAVRAYPLHDLQKESVVNDHLGGRPLAIFRGPEQDSVKTTVWERRREDLLLSFEFRDGRFTDSQTGTEWSIEGKGVQGRLKGEQLNPIHFTVTRWHSWCYTHPATEVWRTNRDEAPGIDLGIFAPAIATWRTSERVVEVERAILNLERPLESDEGLVLHVDGDRLKLHHFENATAADDFVYFNPPSIRRGLVVLESDPQEQFTDLATQRVRLPHDVIKWSRLLLDETFVSALAHFSPAAGRPTVGLRAIIEGLNKAGFDCFPGIATPMNQDCPIFSPMLTPIGRLPGVDNGVYVTMASGDPFVIYRFGSVDRAKDYVQNEEEQAIAIGPYVFRSIPINMFIYPRFALVDRPVDKVAWSDLLRDEDFAATLRSIIGAPG
jgi:hypothetical protein